MNTVLVTGGHGFIGSHFIRHLLRNDIDCFVINLDSLTYAGCKRNLEELSGHPRYHFVLGSIADSECLQSVFSHKIDAIIHFAAESHVGRSIENCEPFMRTNVLGTQTLLEAVRKFGVRRFLQISTYEVYASLGRSESCTERTPLSPSNPYAASKGAADLLVLSYMRTYGVPAMISRSPNNYGPGQHTEKLIPRSIIKLLRNEPVLLHGDGQSVRDWIHVQDHCVAIEMLLRHGKVGETYNISGKCELTNLAVIHALLEILDKPRSLIRFVPDRPAQESFFAMDDSKFRHQVGWSPAIPFVSGLLETTQWYQKNLPNYDL